MSEEERQREATLNRRKPTGFNPFVALGATFVAARPYRFEGLSDSGLLDQRGSLVVGLFSPTEAEGHFHAPILEVQIERHERIALTGNGPVDLARFRPGATMTP